MQGRQFTKLQIIRTLLTIVGLAALTWLGVFQTNRANLLAAGHAPVSQPRDQLKQADKGGSTSDNQNDDVSKIVGIATLVVLLVQSWISGRQASLMRKQTDIYERQAEIAEGQRQISDRQANIAQRQTEIITSQRDISLATERPWVRADIRITGPVQIAQSAVTLSFEVALINSGTLPAYATRPDINVYPWGARTGVSDDHITYRWMRFKPDRVIRQSVIFPQQTVVLDYQGSIRVSEIEQALNTRGQGKDGFVAAIRGVVWYDYPGTDEVHSTIFHAHIVRKGKLETPASWETLPAEDGVFVPAVDLMVTHQIGETHAT